MARYERGGESIEVARDGRTISITCSTSKTAAAAIERLVHGWTLRAADGAEDAAGSEEARFLAHLDRAHAKGLFPYPLHDRMDYAGMRVHAYRGKKRYALLFEMIMHDREKARADGGLGFVNFVFVFRDDGTSIVWNDRALPLKVKSASAKEGGDVALLRGKRVAIPKGKEPATVLRHLVDTHRKDIFANDIERATLMRGTYKLLTVDAWHYAFTAPSQLEAMQQLAAVLVSGDEAKYRPKAKPNTDWRKLTQRRSR